MFPATCCTYLPVPGFLFIMLQWGPFKPTEAASQTASGRIIDGPWFEEAKAVVFVHTTGGVSHSSSVDMQVHVLCMFVFLSRRILCCFLE